MVQLSQHVELILDHLLIALDILLEYYLDRDFLVIDIRFPNDAVRARTQRPAELILCFPVVAVRLPLELAEHA